MTLEQVFIKEFRSATGVVAGYKDVYKVPLPESKKDWDVSGTEMYAVKGIEEPYFSLLNKTTVQKLPRGYEVKRRVIDKATRSFKKNDDGSYAYSDVQVPSGSMVVLSDVQIGLPYKLYCTPPKGYGYIDFIQYKGGTAFVYIVPKDYLYKVNQTALVVSVKNMKNYWGQGYLTWDMGLIYLHVIPYNPNSKYTGSKILKTGMSLDYSKEAKEIVQYWQEKGVIPNIGLSALLSGENLCLKPTIVGYESYIPIELAPVNSGEILGSEGGIRSDKA